MKNIVNKASLLAAIVSVISVTSCNKEYLEQPPIGSLSQSTLATKTGINGLLIGAYSLLDETGGWGGAAYYKGPSNWVFGTIASDDAKEGFFGNLPESEMFEAYKVTPTNSILGFKWGECYSGIQRANDVLRLLPALPANTLTAAEALQIKSEATFLRAVFHFDLAKVFLNIPYVDESVSFAAGNYNVPNNTPIWPKIEADFNFAATNLTATKASAGRANSWAAKAYLAKVYMFQDNFSKAKPLLDDIIANGTTATGVKYALVNFFDNFNALKKNGAEAVFAVQYSVGDGSLGANGNQGDVLNQPLTAGATGGGALQPSFSLVNSFKTDAVTGLPLLDTYNETDMTNDQGLKASDPFTPYTGTVDPRLDNTVARRDIPLLDHGLFGVYWLGFQNIGGPYHTKKFFFSKGAASSTAESYGGWTMVNSTNYNLIRFADVLLWAAEVEVEIGSLAVAEGYVNRIRARAADPASWVKKYVDNNDPSKGFTNIPAANYKVGLYTGQFQLQGIDFARKAVRFERKLELALEGHRFFDLQRWDNGTGYMANTLNAYLDHERKVPKFDFPNGRDAVFTKGKNEIYPIPQAEIDVSSASGTVTLKQNPGY
ncbi:MAG: RagB/SusD family nutrient uptake outer membrane protein [Chitinophagaceae bacterium]